MPPQALYERCFPYDESNWTWILKWILCSLLQIQIQVFDLVSPFQKGFVGFEIQRIQIQINGLVIYTVLCSIYDGVRISQMIQRYFLLKCVLSLGYR